jgi:hypothetical protein
MYCGGHLNSRPYGEVAEAEVVEETETLEVPES